MQQPVPAEDAGLQRLDSHSIRQTNGGFFVSIIGLAGNTYRLTEWLVEGSEALSSGAAESAAEMPGLK